MRHSRPLVAAGLLSAGIYVMLAARLPWWRFGGVPQSWARLLGKSAGNLAVAVGTIGLLMALFVWGLRFVRRENGANREIIWSFAVVFAVTLLWLQPITSDLYAYLCQAHMLTDLGANPLLQAPAEVSGSLARVYPTVYGTRPSAYGPAWILLSAVGTVGQYDLPVGMLLLKGLVALAYLVTAWLVERILLETRPEKALVGLYFFAWNPLVLLMGVGDGHNDMVLVALVLLALWLLLKERWALSFALLILSVWVKYVSLVLVPLFGVYCWRCMARGQHHDLLATTARGGLAVAAVSLLAAGPLMSLETLKGIVMRFLKPLNWSAGAGEMPSLVLAIGLCLYSIAYLVLLLRSWRGSGSFQQLVDSGVLVFLLAFVLGAARSQPWHLLWAAGIAGLSSKRWAQRLIVVLSGLMLAVQVGVEWGVPSFG